MSTAQSRRPRGVRPRRDRCRNLCWAGCADPGGQAGWVLFPVDCTRVADAKAPFLYVEGCNSSVMSTPGIRANRSRRPMEMEVAQGGFVQKRNVRPVAGMVGDHAFERYPEADGSARTVPAWCDCGGPASSRGAGRFAETRNGCLERHRASSRARGRGVASTVIMYRWGRPAAAPSCPQSGGSSLARIPIRRPSSLPVAGRALAHGVTAGEC